MSTNATPEVGGLRAARLRAGFTQERLAVAAGCTGGYVRLLDRGFAPQHSAVLPRLFAVLNGPHNDIDPAGNRVEVPTERDGARDSG